MNPKCTLLKIVPFNPQNLPYHCLLKAQQRLSFTLSTPIYKHPLAIFPRESNFAFKAPSLSSYSSLSSPTPTSSYPEDPFRTGRFLSNEELEKLRFLGNFRYFRELKSGSMWVRVMRAEEIDIIVGLVAESFAESIVLPSVYVSVLRFLHKQYLIKRITVMPHMAMLVGFYRGALEGGEEQEVQLAGSVEVCFDKLGANASLPTPTPPKDSPYICNMAVKTSLRRRGIGWHLLKASEELISQMSSTREVYLHCRMIDAAPFNMYSKAGYKVVKTDSILVFLTLQRRKHLMCKNLPFLSNYVESDLSDSDKQDTTWI